MRTRIHKSGLCRITKLSDAFIDAYKDWEFDHDNYLVMPRPMPEIAIQELFRIHHPEITVLYTRENKPDEFKTTYRSLSRRVSAHLGESDETNYFCHGENVHVIPDFCIVNWLYDDLELKFDCHYRYYCGVIGPDL